MSTSDENFDIKKELSAIKKAEEKLTDWKNEPKVADLKEDIEGAKPSQQAQVSKIKRWNELRDIIGDSKPPKVKGRSQVQPKMVRRQAEWKYPTLSEPFLSTQEMYKVAPVTFEDTASAEKNQTLLNHQFRTKIDRVAFTDELVRSCVDDGTAITQVGWERVTKTVKETVPEYSFFPITDPVKLQEFGEALDIYKANPKEFSALAPEVIEAVNYYLENEGSEPVYAEQTGEVEVEVEKVLTNKPTLDLIDPANAYIDPTCNGDLNKAMFFAITFETSRAELLKNPDRYKNIDAIDWANLAPVTDPDHKTGSPQDFQFKDATRKKVLALEYWGFYDIEGDGELVPIVATWIGDVMIRMEKNPFPDQKIPFILTRYMPVKRSSYGEADAELIEENQRTTGAIMRGIVDLLGRSANSQQGVPKGLMDPANYDRYLRGENYEYNPNGGNPAQAIITHTFPEIPVTALNMLNMLSTDTDSLTGTKSFGEGLSGSAYGNVAAGIKGMLTAQALRDMNILRRLSKTFKEIGQKICAMNAVWLSDKEVIRITNKRDEGDYNFIEINREDLEGQFDLIVDVSTTEVDNMQARDLEFLLQTMGPNMDPEMRNLIMAEIAKLKKQPELAHRIKNHKPEPDPMVQRLQELEIQRAELEIAKLQSEISVNQAKAASLQADAQETQVNTAQDASGLNHERNMEQQRAQAKGNQALEVTKGLLKSPKPGEGLPDVNAAIGYNSVSDTLLQQRTNPQQGYL